MAEVVIETPQHNLNIATMDHQTVRNILQSYKVRYTELSRDDRVNLITIFRNNGEKAGTSLEHPHSQIVATPIVPPHVRDQMTKCQVAYDTYGACVFCYIYAQRGTLPEDKGSNRVGSFRELLSICLLFPLRGENTSQEAYLLLWGDDLR